MKTLLVMRHAKSDWDDPALLDHDRPLNKRGRKAAARIGQLMVEQDLLPDAVLCSTSLRTRQTCDLLLEQWPRSPAPRFLPDLYLCPTDRLWNVLREIPEDSERVLILGHNPELADFLAATIDFAEKFPTAGLAWLTASIDHWSALTPDTPFQSRNFWRPRDLE